MPLGFVIFINLLLLQLIISEKLVKPAERIIVGFSKREPFVYANQFGTLIGLDVSIMENFAKKLNLKLELVEQNISLNELTNDNEKVFEDYIRQCDVQKIDIFIGALDESILTQEHFIASRPYYDDTLTWCVQPKQPIPNWQNIFYVCRDPIAITICFSTRILLTSIAYFMQRFENFTPKWNWWRLSSAGLAGMIGLGTRYFANTIPNRIFFMTCLFGSILSYVVTNSFILLFITIPIYEHQIETRQELIQQRFEPVGDAFALRHLRMQNEAYPQQFLFPDRHFWLETKLINGNLLL